MSSGAKQSTDDASSDSEASPPSPSRNASQPPPTASPQGTVRPSLGPALYPPFYNKPPTPLPPSPSLTSLLRPPFSAATSRPTSPDTSDPEITGTATSTAAAVAKSARTATTVPRATPKVPTYEYYGFTLYLASGVAFIGYLLWAYLPSPFLHQLGIYYYPSRWWALAVPIWLVMAIVYVYVALASYNTTYLTLPLRNVENMVDGAANIAMVDLRGNIIRKQSRAHLDQRHGTVRPGQGRRHRQTGSRDIDPTRRNVWQQPPFPDWRSLWNEGTDAVMDVPLGGVCEILYREQST